MHVSLKIFACKGQIFITVESSPLPKRHPPTIDQSKETNDNITSMRQLVAIGK